MKLITLNIWGGHIRDPLLDFIRRHQEIDIFCFQEVYHNAFKKISTEGRRVSLNIFSELQALLPNHHSFFRPVVNNSFGIGTFIKKGIEVLAEGEISIHENPNYPGEGPTHPRNLQWIQCRMNQQIHSIMNIHGLWNGRGKNDAPERIVQSRKIRRLVDATPFPKIMCGDFNLRPDTKSMAILKKGMNDLIELFNVQSTRTSLYPKAERFADYILTSPEIPINHFAVLPDEVSDHSPLLLDFMPISSAACSKNLSVRQSG